MKIFFLILLAVGTITSGCGEAEEGEQKGPDDQSIVIGAIYNLTGPQSGLDIPSSEGAQLAVEQINSGGGLLGRSLYLALEDGETSTTIIPGKVQNIFKDYPDVVGLIGLSDSDMLLAATSDVAQEKRLFLTSGATSPKLPSEVPTWLFLACFGDNVQAAAAAEWAWEEDSARTVAVLYDSSKTYTRLLQGYFVKRFTELGGKVLSTTAFTPESVESIPADLQSADIVFLSAAPDIVYQAVHQLRENGMMKPIIGGDGFDLEDVWRQHPEVNDVYFTTHAWLGKDNSNQKATDFRQAYEEMFQGTEPDAFSALGYDAIGMLADAIDRAGSTDPDRVLNALASTQNYKGVTGTISYEKGSRIPKKSVTILEVREGIQKFVTEWMPQSVPSP